MEAGRETDLQRGQGRGDAARPQRHSSATSQAHPAARASDEVEAVSVASLSASFASASRMRSRTAASLAGGGAFSSGGAVDFELFGLDFDSSVWAAAAEAAASDEKGAATTARGPTP